MTTTTVPTTTTTPRIAFEIPQYSPGRVLGVWAAAALPMGALTWVGAPLLARTFDGPTAFTRALILLLTAGLLWQFVLLVYLVVKEQGTFRWPVLRRALWLTAPESPRDGRRGGRLWWVLLPMTLLFGAEELIPDASHPLSHDFSAFLDSAVGRELLSGGGWLAVVLTMMVLNTVLGEELLFRGLLMPRMSRAFGRWDWVANGVLFAAYHLHQPWSMPAALVDTVAISLGARRYRSALLGILVHSAQTVFLAVIAISLMAG